MVTFTDGVFAIVITILVLDIRVPDFGSGQALLDSIEELQPTLVAFVVSFFLVGMYWSLHTVEPSPKSASLTCRPCG